MMWNVLLLAAIELVGVQGEGLRARAFFDANNVKVGDPLVLTVDFIGAADFTDIHPPALSRAVNRKDWRVDDASAKTDTFNDARRLTYRVRPLREGVIYFPALEYEYQATDGSKRIVRANEIPVHAKRATAVVVEEMNEMVEANEAPQLDLIREAPEGLSDDILFAWRKALVTPSADRFAAFDFPAAKLNEATCAIQDGNWARAMKVYSALEWQTGQTPEIERGIRSALALRYDNPAVDLPMWRQVMRPLLKYDWKGRVGIILGALVVLIVLFVLIGRGIAFFAAFAFVLFTFTSFGETIETVTTNADGSITTTTVVKKGNYSYQSTRTVGGSGGQRGSRMKVGGFEPFSLFERTPETPVKIGVGLKSSKREVVVGETFELTLTVEHPRTAALASAPRLTIGEMDFFELADEPHALQPQVSPNPTNVLERYVFPLRANASYLGPLHYSVEGDFLASRHSFFATPRPYASGVKTLPLVVEPLPTEGRPDDFSGILAESLTMFERPDMLRVETNDVITIAYQLRGEKMYIPKGFLPPGAAFEWTKGQYQGYCVADGRPTTPRSRLSYYNTRQKAYKTISAGETPIVYTKKEN